MATEHVLRTIVLRKPHDGKELLCRVHVYEDGSAYVEGDELEIIFEEAASACDEAISYVEGLGYSQVPFRTGKPGE